MEDFIYIGRVANTHGIKGGMKIFPTTEDPRRFEQLKSVWLEKPDGTTVKMDITQIKYFKNFVLLQFAQVQTMTEAEGYKQSIVKIPRSQALPLEEDEYYLGDLLGMEVWLEDGSRLGTLSDVIFTGSNDVYVVKREEGKDLLLPAIKSCVLSVDMKDRRILVRVPAGLW
ncbi:ribosome maturation factor RimM [Anaerotalea alkaliphila]|uniref:Ribosome maturation factor RimM n=1 Tax=Anaerotalea alkaliphila TaxID=2662126 RepID=A0A7X5KNU6_9FIRM|nr:ribosome maturation factor RimM [Anaerotalea alkaliphila]NDL68178.1 16S rRNA processing protein RimM [Anaerotalea alkaliphila]